MRDRRLRLLLTAPVVLAVWLVPFPQTVQADHCDRVYNADHCSWCLHSVGAGMHSPRG